MSSASSKLSVQDLRQSFRNTADGSAVEVLGGISFEVAEGEIVALIGESGCGKTTLLRCIQGLTRYHGGRIEIDGQAIDGPGRNRGFVFQQPALLPWRSARRNVEFGLELMGQPRSELHQRADQLLALVGLGAAADKYPHQLSGGMQQRVGLARALAIGPAILLMDEPFSALDAQTREVLQAELLRIRAETRQTTLLVTHDIDEAVYLADRIVVLAAHPGRVRAVLDVPLPQPRPPLRELRADPAFLQLRQRVWELIGAGDGGVA